MADDEAETRRWCADLARASLLKPLAGEPLKSRRRDGAFILYLQHIDAVVLPPVYEDLDVTAQINVTFFDDTNKQVFGRTWVSEPCKVVPTRNQRGRVDIEVNQHVWFKTKLEDENCYGILEVIFHAPTFEDDSVQDLEPPVLPAQVVGGWLLVNMFPALGIRPLVEKPEDIPTQRDSNVQQLDILPGSPHMLFMLEHRVPEALRSLGLQNKAQGQISVSFLEATSVLSKYLRFVPANMIVSRYTRVPGLVDRPRVLFSSDNAETWEWIRDTAIEEAKTFIASDWLLHLGPSLQLFEDTLLDHIWEHMHTLHPSMKDKEPSARQQMNVTQRQLRVGLHNGLTFLQEPTQLLLAMQSTDTSLVNSQGHHRHVQENDPDTDSDTPSPRIRRSQADACLRFDGTIELRDVMQVPEVAVTLELVYTIAVPVVLNQPVGRQAKALSRAFAHQQSIAALPTQIEHTHCLRFGCIFPFSETHQVGVVSHHNVALLGPPLTTPGNDLLFSGLQLNRDNRVFLTRQFCTARASVTLAVADVSELLGTRGEDLGKSVRHAVARAFSTRERGSRPPRSLKQRPQSAEPEMRTRSRKLPMSPEGGRTQSLHIPHLRQSMILAESRQEDSKGGLKQRAVSFLEGSSNKFLTPHRPISAPETSTGHKGKRPRPLKPPAMESLLEVSGEGDMIAAAPDIEAFEAPELKPLSATGQRLRPVSTAAQPHPPSSFHDIEHDMKEVDTTIQPDEVTVAQLPLPQHAIAADETEQVTPFPGVSRALQAELAQAHFPAVVTEEDLRHMKIPAAILPLPPGPNYLQKEIELQDIFVASRVTLQFLALEWTTSTAPQLPGVPPRIPHQRVIITFKLHKLPQYVSPPLSFHALDDHSPRLGGVLHVVDTQTTEPVDTPGCLASMLLDPRQLGVAHESLLAYLNSSALEIQIVDADSLLPIGVASMALACFLRGGFRGVQSSLELDVIDMHALSDQILFSVPRNRNDRVAPVQLVGKLCVRCASVGQPSRSPPGVQRLLVPSAFPESVLINPVSGHGRRHRVQTASKLLQDDPRARAVLHNAEDEEADAARKAARLRAVQAKRQELFNNQQLPLSFRVANPQIRPTPVSVRDSSDLHAIQQYRMRQKRSVIQTRLQESMKATVDLCVAYGYKMYLEYRLQNPSHDTSISVLIKSSCKNLQVVANHEEWRAILQENELDRKVEVNMFNMTRDGPVVLLRPLEEVFVPLKYTLPSAAIPPWDPQFLSATAFGRHERTHVPPIHEKLQFESLDGLDFGSVDVVIHPQEPIVDHHIDLYTVQNSIFRHRIRLPPYLTDVVAVLCSDPDVLVHLDNATSAGIHDIVIKCSSGRSPLVSSFLLLLYDNEWSIQPTTTWRIAIHAVETCTLAVQLGEVSNAVLTLRPSQPVAHARVFSADETQLEALPKTPFSLAGNALAEIGLRAHPTALGVSRHLVHVVDIEFKRILYTYQVVLETKPPHVSKTFEIALAATDSHVNKRIGYINRFQEAVEISLFTTSPQRVQFKHRHLVLEPNEKGYIGIRALPSQVHVEEEVYIFLVDALLRLQDAFKLRLLTL
eukprot:m.99006 g.99006  ORF g.99006 m.99006 type:complete len:1566 (+) comp14886_c0_seq1:69-4766(+)